MQELALFNLQKHEKEAGPPSGRITPAQQKLLLELIEVQNVRLGVPKSQQKPTSELPLFSTETQTKLF